MLSLPDFTEKKILFISPQKQLESQLRFGNSNLKLYRDEKIENQISLHLLVAVFIIGDFTITSYLIRQFKEHAISLFLLNNSFKQYASVSAEAEGNTQLRAIQYRLSPEQELLFSRHLIKNKVENQQLLITNYLKQKPSFALETTIDALDNAVALESILGLEGNIAKKYFKQIYRAHDWYRRAPTTKEDIPNLLLDIGYSFLFNFTDALLRLFGFDTYKGFYHTLYFQRKSLSCDVMEPMRYLIDKALLKAYSLDQVKFDDFIWKNGSFEFKNWEVQKKYLRIFSEAIMDNKDDMYAYVLEWYRFYHNQEKYQPPVFKVRV